MKCASSAENADDMVSNADNMGHNDTPKACLEARCEHIDDCVGVDRRYLEEYGDEEMRIWLSEPSSSMHG